MFVVRKWLAHDDEEVENRRTRRVEVAAGECAGRLSSGGGNAHPKRGSWSVGGGAGRRLRTATHALVPPAMLMTISSLAPHLLYTVPLSVSLSFFNVRIHIIQH